MMNRIRLALVLLLIATTASADFDTSQPVLRGGTDGALIGNTSDRLRTETRLQDGSGNAVTSQVNGSQRALDVGINVSGAQIDPRTQGTAAAVSGAWPVKLTDGTSTTVVKAASTAPVATDPALVVVQSPNGNHATAANQSTQITSLQLLDDVVGSASGGTAGTKSNLIGGQYNVTLPVLTDGQQAAIQVDQNGRIVTSAITGFGADFRFGDVVLSSVTTAAVRRTAYTEPAASAAFSIKSSSASDTSAGTGARTVQITYYDGSASSLSTETVTLNGTTCVNSVTTTAHYFEKVNVLTVGSGTSNAGTLTFYTGTGCSTTVGTIGIGENQTFWAHHYVPTGRVSNITGLSAGSTSAATGNGSVYVIKSTSLATANAAEVQVGDFHTLFGQSSTVSRVYSSPIKVTGPARVVAYVTTLNGSTITYRSAIDFFEP